MSGGGKPKPVVYRKVLLAPIYFADYAPTLVEWVREDDMGWYGWHQRDDVKTHPEVTWLKCIWMEVECPPNS